MSDGIPALGCQSCHGSSAQSIVALVSSATAISPGDTVTFTITIQHAGAAAGGVYVPNPGVGSLMALTGQGLSLGPSGLVHAAPKPAKGGVITFQFGWRAPTTPGAVRFEVYGNAVNGDRTSNGDAPGEGTFPFVFGCSAKTFYFDADGDGFGAELFDSTLGCSDQPAPIGYSANDDDCDDTHDTVHPGAPEVCNGRDDDCDRVIDDATACCATGSCAPREAGSPTNLGADDSGSPLGVDVLVHRESGIENTMAADASDDRKTREEAAADRDARDDESAAGNRGTGGQSPPVISDAAPSVDPYEPAGCSMTLGSPRAASTGAFGGLLLAILFQLRARPFRRNSLNRRPLVSLSN